MFRKYRVTWKFRNEFAAGIPENPEALLAFLEARAPERRPEDAIPLEELAEQVAQEIHQPSTEREAALTTTFKEKNGALVYEARGVKAHIKDCASVLSKMLGITAFKAKVANRADIKPQFIPLTRNGQPITEVDGSEIRPVTTMTRLGPRTAVKIVKYVLAPELTFELLVLDDGVITEQHLRSIFQYGGNVKGAGQDRGLGWGRYDFTMEEVGA